MDKEGFEGQVRGMADVENIDCSNGFGYLQSSNWNRNNNGGGAE